VGTALHWDGAAENSLKFVILRNLSGETFSALKAVRSYGIVCTMKNTISLLSDIELLSTTKKLVTEEKKLTIKVLWHLREVEKRMLYARRGFHSLYEYAREELGYSEGAAHRRIASMRLLKELPELESKVESGALPLSTLAQAHSFFRVERLQGTTVKREIMQSLENKSHREVQKELVSRSTQPEKHFSESLKPVSASHHKMSILLDEGILKDLEELRAVLGATRGKLSIQEVIQFALRKALEVKRLKASKPDSRAPAPELDRKLRAKSLASVPHAIRERPKSRSRYIPIELRRQVWSRDKGCCSYKDFKTGKRCGSKSGLELDHIHDFASGGDHRVDNLRLRCRAHNTLAAVDRFGALKMSRYIASLRSEGGA